MVSRITATFAKKMKNQTAHPLPFLFSPCVFAPSRDALHLPRFPIDRLDVDFKRLARLNLLDKPLFASSPFHLARIPKRKTYVPLRFVDD